jgi:hypothetical protein
MTDRIQPSRRAELGAEVERSINGTDLDVTAGMLAGPFAPPNRNS